MNQNTLRLTVLLALFTLLSSFVAGAAEKETFVLVHGATAGGWEWKRTFPGGHIGQQEDPRGVATLIEESVKDRNNPVAPK